MNSALRPLEDMTGRARASGATGLFGEPRTRGGGFLISSTVFCISEVDKARDRQAACWGEDLAPLLNFRGMLVNN